MMSQGPAHQPAFYPLAHQPALYQSPMTHHHYHPVMYPPPLEPARVYDYGHHYEYYGHRHDNGHHRDNSNGPPPLMSPTQEWAGGDGYGGHGDDSYGGVDDYGRRDDGYRGHGSCQPRVLTAEEMTGINNPKL